MSDGKLSQLLKETIADLHSERTSERSDERERTSGRSPVTTVYDSLGIEARGPHRSFTGSKLGRFEIEEELGRGGMGVVYKARDPILDRTVALKLMSDTGLRETALQRFLREARINGQLEHPNIVPVHQAGVTDDGRIFLVMRLVHGRTLRRALHSLSAHDTVTSELFSRGRLLAVFEEVCSAVAYAHDRGVLHRDLKPANVMMGGFGEVQVLDWGVAALWDAVGEARVGRGLARYADLVCGTPGYMSPEQAKGSDDLDPRSDVFSLGAMLYEILFHKPAFTGRTKMDVLMATADGPPDFPAEGVLIPLELQDICRKALQSDRSDRYETAGGLAAALRGFLDRAQRREGARIWVDRARMSWLRYGGVAGELERLQRLCDELDASRAPWIVPGEDPAEELRHRARNAERTGADAFRGAVAAAEQALYADPGSLQARDILADAYWALRRRALDELRPTEAAFFEARVRTFNTDRYDALLDGNGELNLDCSTRGAKVTARRFHPAGPALRPGPEETLGRSPLLRRSLPAGSWVLRIRAPGMRECRVPVLLRGGPDHHEPLRVSLLSDEQIGEGMLYVPGGPFLSRLTAANGFDGIPRTVEIPGFLIAETHVTLSDWADFLNALAAVDPDEAERRTPRLSTPPDGGPRASWSGLRFRDGWRVPDGVEPTRPVTGVSVEDARAFCAWRTETSGWEHRLPTEAQWEKAARGVDGRLFPWGDGADPQLCCSRESRPVPAMLPVGSVPTDNSVYGLRDSAGNAADLCRTELPGDLPPVWAVRGGAWTESAADCRISSRRLIRTDTVSASVGFRFVRPLPEAVS